MGKKKIGKMTRRQFVKSSAVVGLAAATSRCSSITPTSSVYRSPAGDTGPIITDVVDYLVIGSGAGGGPVACNLAKFGQDVMILEAGGDGGKHNARYDVPAFHPQATEDPDMAWNFFVKHYDDKNTEYDLQGSKYRPEKDGTLYPRSGTLGGCTAHNAMITLYPDNEDWAYIAELCKDSTWDPKKMYALYNQLKWDRSGTLDDYEADHRTNVLGKWLSLENLSLGAKFQDIEHGREMFNIAIGAAGGLRPKQFLQELLNTPDSNAYVEPGQRRGVGNVSIPITTVAGHRMGTREYIIRTINSGTKLRVKLDCLATRIMFDGSRASGVEYIELPRAYTAHANYKPNNPETAVRKAIKVKREVILAGGAFNSPQLLMLSGIGDPAELRLHGIDPIISRIGVGKNLQDRYEIGVTSKLKVPFGEFKDCTFGQLPDKCLNEFGADARKTGYSSNGAITSFLRRSKVPGLSKNRPPDLCIFALPGGFHGYFPGWSKKDNLNLHDYFTWAILKGHTNNTAGTVTLRSDKPWDTPIINFNYFANDTNNEDLNAVVDGIEYAIKLNQIPRINKLIETEFNPNVRGASLTETEKNKLPTDPKELKEFVKRETWGHHASCTNQMGPPEKDESVVDNKFKLIGTDNVRIVDASVFPRIPGLFIVLPTYMIAEKASRDILSARGISLD